MTDEEQFDKLFSIVTTTSTNLQILVEQVKHLKAEMAFLSDQVANHKEELLRLKIKDDMKGTFVTWISRNWMSIILGIGFLGELFVQIKGMR